MLGPIRSALGTVAFLAIASSVSAASSSTRGATGTKSMSKYALQSQFIRAMNAATRDDAEAQKQMAELRRLRQKESRAKFERNLIAKSVSREEAEAQAGIVRKPDFMRKLEDAANDAEADADANAEANENDNDNQNNNNNQQQEEEEEVDYNGFGFDPSNYSLKYTSCSAVNMYSDEAAEREEMSSATVARKFVVFRLCPTDTCSAYFYSSAEDRHYNYHGSKACGDSFGEYLIPLETYLEEYGNYIDEMKESYCEYCHQCLYFEHIYYENYRERDLGADDYYQMNDDANAADMYAGNDANGDYHACKYYKACSTFMNVCDNDGADYWNNMNQEGEECEEGDEDCEQNQQQQQEEEKEEEIEYERFFQCERWERDQGNNNGGQNGQNYYNNNNNIAQYYWNDGEGLFIGPRCAEDGYTIEFGIYSDEWCSNDVTDKVSLEELTGDATFGSDYLGSFTDQQCVSCKESDLPYNVNQDDNQDEDDITELCEVMYQQSAKCNANLQDALEGSYIYTNQYKNEEEACKFIDSVVRGAYNQKGDIVIDEESFSIQKIIDKVGAVSKSVTENWSDDAPPSIGAIFAIGILALGCVAMLVAACFLRRSLNQWNEAKFKRSLMQADGGASGVSGGDGSVKLPPNGDYGYGGGTSHPPITWTDSGVTRGRSFADGETA